jgi:hypothetical protein
VLVVAVVWPGSGGGGSGRAAEPASTLPPAPSTTLPPTTPATTVAPTPTTTFVRVETGTPLVSAAKGVVLYAGTTGDDILRVELSTGGIERRTVPHEAGRGGPWMVLGRASGAVVTQMAFDDHAPVLGVPRGATGRVATVAEWIGTNNGPPVSPQIVAAAEPDEVWVSWTDDAGPIRLGRVRLNGTVTAGPVTVPRSATIVRDDGPGAVLLNGPDGSYRATVTGETVRIQRVSRDPLIAATPRMLLTSRCSIEFVCDWGVVNRATGERRSLGAIPDSIGQFWNTTVSPDGRYLLQLVDTPTAGAHVQVHDLTSGRLVLDDAVDGQSAFGPSFAPGSLGSFSADGRWLVWMDRSSQIKVWRTGSSGPPTTLTNSALDNVTNVSVAP